MSDVPRCIHCRYDLTGITGKCPECGWVIDPALLYLTRIQAPAKPSRGRVVLAVFSVLMMLFVAAVVAGIVVVIFLYATAPQPVKP